MEEYPLEWKATPTFVNFFASFSKDQTLFDSIKHDSRQSVFVYVESDTQIRRKKEKRAYEGYKPEGILKASWMRKHQEIVPGTICLSVPFEDEADWKIKESAVANFIESFKARVRNRPATRFLILLDCKKKLDHFPDLSCLSLVKKRCELDSEDFMVLPFGADQKEMTTKIQKCLLDFNDSFCKDEIKRIKKLKSELGGTVFWVCRHRFKMAYLCEMRRDAPNAIKYYQQSYSALKEVALMDEYFEESKLLSELVTFRLTRLRLADNMLTDAVSNFLAHMRWYRKTFASTSPPAVAKAAPQTPKHVPAPTPAVPLSPAMPMPATGSTNNLPMPLSPVHSAASTPMFGTSPSLGSTGVAGITVAPPPLSAPSALQLPPTAPPLPQLQSEIIKASVKCLMHALVCRQERAFAQVLEQHGKEKLTLSDRYQNPGFYYHSAAMAAMERRKAAQKAASQNTILEPFIEAAKSNREKGGKETAVDSSMLIHSVGPQELGVYVGQTNVAKEHPLESQRSYVDPMIIETLHQKNLSIECVLDHSSIIVTLLNSAYQYFSKLDASHSLFHVADMMANEYFSEGKFETAKKFYDRISKGYRKEKWWSVLSDVLLKALVCSQKLGHTKDCVDASLELMSNHLPLAMEEKMNLFNVVMASAGERTPLSPDLSSLYTFDSPPLYIDLESDQPFLSLKVQFETSVITVNETVPFHVSVSTASPAAFSLSQIQVAFSDPAHNIKHEPLEGKPLLMDPSRPSMFTFPVTIREKKEIECVSVVLFVGTGLAFRWKFTDGRGIKGQQLLSPDYDFRNEIGSGEFIQRTAVRAQQPVPNVVFEQMNPTLCALRNETFPIELKLNSNGDHVTAGTVKISAPEHVQLRDSLGAPQTSIDLSFAEIATDSSTVLKFYATFNALGRHKLKLKALYNTKLTTKLVVESNVEVDCVHPFTPSFSFTLLRRTQRPAAGDQVPKTVEGSSPALTGVYQPVYTAWLKHAQSVLPLFWDVQQNTNDTINLSSHILDFSQFDDGVGKSAGGSSNYFSVDTPVTSPLPPPAVNQPMPTDTPMGLTRSSSMMLKPTAGLPAGPMTGSGSSLDLSSMGSASTILGSSTVLPGGGVSPLPTAVGGSFSPPTSPTPSAGAKFRTGLVIGEPLIFVFKMQSDAPFPVKLSHVSFAQDPHFALLSDSQPLKSENVLNQGDVHTFSFTVKPTAAVTQCSFGQLSVTLRRVWSEDKAQNAQAAASDAPLVVDCPLVIVQPASIHVSANIPPEGVLGKPIAVDLCLSNPTDQMQDVQISVVDSDSFMFSGVRTTLSTLQPRAKTTMSYCMLPVACGHVSLPQFVVVDKKREISVLNPSEKWTIFIHPEER